MSPKLNILVVGGGISGPVMAMALRKATHHNIILVDAGPEDAKPIGAALGVSPNGIKALEFIGADQIVREKGHVLPYFEAGKGPSGSMLMHQEAKELFTSKCGTPVGSIFLFFHSFFRIELNTGIRNTETRTLSRVA
jgi:2-polyprenyl-6-methoxyphenol hydroxylase-like FAD-dependent oxidoreductase